MNNGILLLGPPGVGKTYWGKQIAAHLKIPFYDLDELIISETQLSIHQIFEEGGEQLFRKIESSILLEMYHNQVKEKYILALGGGTPAYHNNMEIINQMGTSIYLNLTPDAIINLLVNDKDNHRPLIKNTTDSKLKDYISNLVEERKPFYEMADYMLFGNELNIPNFIKVINDKKYD